MLEHASKHCSRERNKEIQSKYAKRKSTNRDHLLSSTRKKGKERRYVQGLNTMGTTTSSRTSNRWRFEKGRVCSSMNKESTRKKRRKKRQQMKDTPPNTHCMEINKEEAQKTSFQSLLLIVFSRASGGRFDKQEHRSLKTYENQR